MRVWMGLNAVLMGSILGTFAGLGLHAWLVGGQDCSEPRNGGVKAAVRSTLDAGCNGSGRGFVLAAIPVGIALVAAGTWWLLRPSTKS